MPDPTPVPNTPHNAAPHNTAPSNNRAIVAFPFSAVRISSSDETVAALAALVVDLAELVAKEATDPEAHLVADRARALARRVERDSDA